MGWSIGWNDRKELINHLTRSQSDRRCLKKVTKGNVLWTVWEIDRPGQDAQRYIGCDLMCRFGNKNDGHEWGYKGMCESMGVRYHTCPLSFFQDVPEPPNEYALKWRQRVMELANARSGLKVGDWLITDRRVTYYRITELPSRGRRVGACRVMSCDGRGPFRLSRAMIKGKATDLNEWESKLSAAFPRGWKAGFDQTGNPEPDEFFQTNRYPGDKIVEILQVSNNLVGLWKSFWELEDVRAQEAEGALGAAA